MSFTFFYDESSHTRKITETAVTADEYFETFICSIIGFNSDSIKEIEKQHLVFESKYKLIFGVKDELKSSVISTKRFRYGLASLFKPNDLSFLREYFDFLINSNAKIYYCFMDKITWVIQQIFKNYYFWPTRPQDWVYSISKALRVYKPIKPLHCLFNKPSIFIKEFKKFLSDQIKINGENPVKQDENAVFQNMINHLIDSVDIKFNKNWDYESQFIGFNLYLKETKTELNCIYLDMESDTSETTKAANKIFSAAKVKNIKSNESWGVRVCDIFCGLLYKITKNMKEYMDGHTTEVEVKSSTGIKIIRLGILDDKWFTMNNEQFDLYKKMKLVLIDLNQAYFKTYSNVSLDNLVILTRFLWYIDSFKSFEEYKKIESKHHVVNFHNYSMEELNGMISNF